MSFDPHLLFGLRSFSWRARVGLGPLTIIRIVDRYAHGVGNSQGLLFGRRSLFAKADEDTARWGPLANEGYEYIPAAAATSMPSAASAS